MPELTQRAERWENTLDAGMDYTVRERYTLDVSYRWFMVDYKDDPDLDQFDRDDHTIAGTLFYRLFPKTSILGEVDYNMVRYDIPAVAVDPRLRRLAFLAGHQGRHDRQDVGPREGRLRMAGLREQRFREDWDGLIAEGNVIWKYREPSEVRLFGGRANVESLVEGAELLRQLVRRGRGPALPQRALVLRVRGWVASTNTPRTRVGGRRVRRPERLVHRGGRRSQVPDAPLGGVRARRTRSSDLNSNFNEFDYTDNRSGRACCSPTEPGQRPAATRTRTNPCVVFCGGVSRPPSSSCSSRPGSPGLTTLATGQTPRPGGAGAPRSIGSGPRTCSSVTIWGHEDLSRARSSSRRTERSRSPCRRRSRVRVDSRRCRDAPPGSAGQRLSRQPAGLGQRAGVPLSARLHSRRGGKARDLCS